MPSSWCAYARASICGYSRGSTPASTRGDSRWSCETGTPAIISPTRLRTASARSSVEPRRRKRRFSYRSRARRVRVIIPDSYAARAKNTPEEPAISVLSRSKNAAAWPSPFSPCIAMSAPSDPEDDRVALSAARADRRAAERAAAVVDARGVARGVRAVLAHQARQRRERLQRGVAARALVDLDNGVALPALDGHRDDLLG